MHLSNYILRNYFLIFVSTLLIVTFTMCLLSIPKMIDILSKGIEIKIIVIYFINLISYFISYSIPISTLFSALLLFGRLSVDGELSAMKSGGLSLWQISSPVILIALVVSIFCLYNNSFIYPQKRYANRVLLQHIDVSDPIRLLDEGRSIRDFPGYIIYIQSKKDNKVKDLIIYELNKNNESIKSCIQSKEGVLSLDKQNNQLLIELYDARIESLNPDEAKNQYAYAQKYSIPLNLNEWNKPSKIVKNRRDMTLPELILNAKRTSEQNLLSGQFWVRIHQRIYMGLAPLTFVLIGIPFGIKSHRKESSYGMILSLLVVFIYYCLILISDGLGNKPELKPWLIPWIGTILAQIYGLYLLHKLN